jgi:hypothetical protein
VEFLPEAAGPHDPILATAARPEGSVRRTANIDTSRPDGLRADAKVDARARDLRTNPDGTTEVLGEARLQATVSPTQKLLSITTTPDVPALRQLVGASVGSGFRARLNEVVTDECEHGSLLYLLLDDLPGATLVSGYVLHRAGLLDDPPIDAGPGETPKRPSPNLDRLGDLCAGWAQDATMMVRIRATGSIPVPLGPDAPVLEDNGDPSSWHAMAALPSHSVRRRRLLDLVAPAVQNDAHRIDLHFRDSHTDEDGNETIMHEYSVKGTADARSGRIVSVAAKAQVLPWLECPGAIASAERIAGMELSSLRPIIPKEFVGRSTCTHLNDSLRSLADITALARELEPPPS